MENGLFNGIRTGILGKIQLIPYLSYWKLFIIRVAEGLGLVRNSDISRDLFRLYWSWGIIQRNELKICILPEAGRLENNSGGTFISKLFSLFGDIDVVQATALNQPFLGGNIAPNERLAVVGPNLGSKYLSHQTISFSSGKPWSLSFVANFNGSNLIGGYNVITTNSNGSNFIAFTNIGKQLSVYFGGVNYILNNDISKYFGKVTHFLFSSDGSTISYMENGVFVKKLVASGQITFMFLNTYIGVTHFVAGKTYFFSIKSAETNINQNLQEYNILRSYFSEIPSVAIGTQTWATGNLDVVCTPQGNLIANVTDDTAWAASQTTYDTTYAATTGTTEQKTYAAVNAAAMWCYYNNDVSIGAVYGKLYNWYAVELMQMDIDYFNAANPSTPWGWRIPTQADFTTLQATLGGSSVAAGKMKVPGIKYWNAPNTGGDNSSGISIIGNGYRGGNGVFAALNSYGTIWLVDVVTSSSARDIWVLSDNAGLPYPMDNTSKIIGIAARYIKV